MDNISFSIVIPVWNVEKYVGECLDSILKQTVNEIEVICVDDLSDDGSLEIINEYAKKDERVKVISLEENLSASVARKKGVLAASGKYILFVDADDTIEPRCCEILIELLKKHPVDILHFGTNIVNANNLPEQRVSNMETFVEPYCDYLYEENVFLACFRERKYKFSLWNKVYDAEVCKKAFSKIKDEKLPKGQDKYAYFLLSYYAKSYYGVNEYKLYNYRFGNGVTGHQFLSLCSFERFCTMANVAQAIKDFLISEKAFDIYKDTYELAKRELLADCVNQWKNHLLDEDRVNGFELIYKYWGTVDTVSGIAKCAWYEQAEVAQILQSSVLLHNQGKKVKTIGVFYFRIENGGAQKVVTQLISLWVEMGYHVVLFTDYEATDRDYWLPDNVERVVLSASDRMNKETYQERAQEIMSWLQKYNIDLFVYHGWINGILLWDMLVTKLSGVAFMIHTHNVFSFLLRNCNPFFYKLPYVFHLSDGIITLSDADTAFWKQFSNNVWQVVNPFSYELIDIEKRKHEGINILWLGRVSSEKRPHDAIKIFKIVHDKIPNSKLIFVGDASNVEYFNSIINLAADMKLLNHIDFCGYQKNVEQYYAMADIHLMTSEYEGFPLTLLESKSARVPCVMYDLPYLSYNKDKRGCITVNMGDINTAAERIIRVCQDAQMLADLGDEALRSIDWIREYDYKAEWTQIFQSIEEPRVKVMPETTERIMWHTLLEHYKVGTLKLAKEKNEFNDIKRNYEEMTQEYNRVNNSYSYKIGLLLTYIPRKLIKSFINLCGKAK